MTVNEALALTPADTAEMVVRPSPTAVASPLSSTVATAVSELVQATEVVTSWLVVSVKVPAAVNCRVSVLATERPATRSR